MNILYIEHYAGSPEMGMEFRPYYLAKEWIKMGHNVTIIAGDYSHLRIKNPEADEDFQEEWVDGIKYIWVKTKKYDGNGFSRAITMYQFVSKIRRNAKKLIDSEKPDAVITSSTYPLDTFAGQKIKKTNKNVKLVHEIHDMWPITLTEVGGMSKWNPFVILMQIGENSFCKKSDYVCSLLPNADEYLVNHGMDKKKFFHVSNGIVLDEWETPKPLPKIHSDLLQRLHSENKNIICFFGSHTKSYNLDCLIDAIKDDNENNVAVFIGNGIYKKELMDKAKAYSQKIFFLDPIPKTCIPDLFKHIDATYVAAVDNDMFRFGICMNKLFDSMMGGKPIIYGVNAPNNYISDYNCGITVKPGDVKSLKKGISKLMSLTSEEQKKLGENGHKAVLDNFTYNKLAEKFINNIKEK